MMNLIGAFVLTHSVFTDKIILVMNIFIVFTKNRRKILKY